MKKYNLKKFQILTALLAVIVVTSCGSSSAPPVDLPAPITGRVTISNPDADGNVSITSIAGAVDADAMVMTVNEEVAGTVSAKILNMLVKSAYAQTSFPSICDDDGYSCAVADADGVFEMTLAASFGDSIVIGVIDETAGEFISEVIRRVVGEVVETVVCADYDVSGAVVDVAVDPVSGGPIILKQGSDTATNQLVMGDSSPVTIPISGCFAHSIIVKEGTNGKPFIIVSSKDDQIIWSGTRSDNTIIEASTQETSDQPMHIAFPLYTNDAFVKASLTSDGYIRIDNISLTTLEQTASNDVSVKSGSSTSPLTDLSASVDLKIIDLDDGDIGVILVNSSYEEGLYLMLFDVESLSILETVTPEDFTSLQIGQASAVALYTDSGENVAIAILDSKNNKLWITHLFSHSEQSLSSETLSYTTDLSSESTFLRTWELFAPTDNVFTLENSSGVSYPLTSLIMTNLNESSAEGTQLIAGPTSDGRLWVGAATNINDDQNADNANIYNVAAGNNLVAIDLDLTLLEAYVADSTASTAVSVGDLIW